MTSTLPTRFQRTRVKICGVTSVDDALASVAAGADAIGLNFVPTSLRRVSIEQASQIVSRLPPYVDSIAVAVDASLDELRSILANAGIRGVQLHGDEPPERVADLAPQPVVKAFRWQGDITRSEIQAFLERCDRLGRLPAGLLLDTHRAGTAGGTGATWNWREAVGVGDSIPLIVAGGLRPENVRQAIETLRPYGVDVAGGVESSPRRKSRPLLEAFVAAVRRTEQHPREDPNG